MCWCPKNQLDVFYQLDFIDSSGKDRLDVFYQLDLSTASGKDRLDSRSLGGKASFEGDLIWLYSSNEGARLRQGTETLEATGTPTAAQSSSDGDLLSLRSHSSYLLCFMNSSRQAFSDLITVTQHK